MHRGQFLSTQLTKVYKELLIYRISASVGASYYYVNDKFSDLVDLLKDQRLPDGTTEFIGDVVVHWVRVPFL